MYRQCLTKSRFRSNICDIQNAIQFWIKEKERERDRDFLSEQTEKKKDLYDVMMVLQAWFTYYHIGTSENTFLSFSVFRKKWFFLFLHTQCVCVWACKQLKTFVMRHKQKVKQTNWNWYSIHISFKCLFTVPLKTKFGLLLLDYSQ